MQAQGVKPLRGEIWQKDQSKIIVTQESASLQEKIERIGTLVQAIMLPSFEDASRNVIWMSKVVFEALFKHETDMAKPKHLQVANKVYIACIHPSLEDDCIGINVTQNKEMSFASCFFPAKSSSTWISPFYTRQTPVHPLSSITIEISKFNEGLSIPQEADVLVKESLSKTLREIFKNQIVARGQEFLFTFNDGKYVASILKMGAKENAFNFHFPYGCVEEETNFKLLPKKSCTDVRIGENAEDEPDSKCYFVVKIPKTYHLNHPEEVPVFFDYNFLKELALKNATENGGKMYLKNKFKSELRSGEYVSLYFTKFVTPNKIYDVMQDENPQIPILNFPVDKTKKFIFKPHNTYLRIRGNVTEAKTILFEVVSIVDKSGEESTSTKLYWINAEEILKKLSEIQAPISNQQLLVISLGQKNIHIKVIKGSPFDPKFNRNNSEGKIGWIIRDGTELKINLNPKLGIYLVENAQLHPLDKVKAAVVPRTFREGHRVRLDVTEEELLEAVREQVKVGIVQGQVIKLDLKQNPEVKIQIECLEFAEIKNQGSNFNRLGQINEKTKIEFSSECEEVVIENSKKGFYEDPKAILKEFKLAGLDTEFDTIIDEILTQFSYPNEMKKRGLQPVRGLLLEGPPGCGKTRLAVAIADMIGCTDGNKQLSVINGPSILNKWVGQSEENLRKIFNLAKAHAMKNKIHVLILEEMDAILSKRKEDSGSPVHNSVVNQFLTLSDGVDQYKFLMIGTTNSKELLDPAVLRSGRFDREVKIPLPRKNGREEIFKVHSEELKKQKLLHENVNFTKLASRTKGLSGADIELVVKLASMASLKRLREAKIPDNSTEFASMSIVDKKDFKNAIEKVKNKIESNEKQSQGHQYYS